MYLFNSLNKDLIKKAVQHLLTLNYFIIFMVPYLKRKEMELSFL